MSGHKFNLPWSFDGRTIKDSTGVPVAVVLEYTSVHKVDEQGFVTYNTSENAGEIRAKTIVEAVNGAGLK